MKRIKKIAKKVLSAAKMKVLRKKTKVEKLAYQWEQNAMLGDENINRLEKKYPNISSTPRQNFNVNNNKKILKMMEEGKLNDEIIATGFGGRTKIELSRAAFDLMKGKLKS